MKKNNTLKNIIKNITTNIHKFFINKSYGELTLIISTLCICFIIIPIIGFNNTSISNKDYNSEVINNYTEETTNNSDNTTNDYYAKESINDSDNISIELENDDTNNISTDIIKYKIQYGDSFWSISKDFYKDTKWHLALMKYNGYCENDILKVGDIIEIPDINEDIFIAIYEEIDQKNIENEIIIPAGNNNVYKYGIRVDPMVDIKIPKNDEIMKNNTENINTSDYIYIGQYTTTGYTPKCIHCCGNNQGIGAAGVPVICGYSVAAPNNIPFGTTIYIEDYGFYVVEDRGAFNSNNIDIACPSHNSCYDVTNMDSYVNVYIVPNN